MEQEQEKEVCCDICGSTTDVMIRVIENDHVVCDALSGFTCEKCLYAGKEKLYLIKLQRRLTRNAKLKTQLAERFAAIRKEELEEFKREYGSGISGTCHCCGRSGEVYLTVTEDHYDDGTVEILDEVSGLYCADCITTGQQKTHISELSIAYLRWRVEYNKYCETADKMTSGQFSENEVHAFIRTMASRSRELTEDERFFDSIAMFMKPVRENYTGKVMKSIIKTAQKGDRCSCCGQICGKDHECREV